MGKHRIEYLPLAWDDIEEIFEYLCTDAPDAAKGLLNRFDETISHLEEFPEIGAIVKNRRLAKQGYRILVIDDYGVFYVVLDELVEIRRMIYGKRNYAKLL
jgi:toxin ParE1/3/4